MKFLSEQMQKQNSNHLSEPHLNGRRNRTDERKIRRRLEKKGKEKQRFRTKVTRREEGRRREDEKGGKALGGLGGSSAMLCMFRMKFLVTHFDRLW